MSPEELHDQAGMRENCPTSLAESGVLGKLVMCYGQATSKVQDTRSWERT